MLDQLETCARTDQNPDRIISCSKHQTKSASPVQYAFMCLAMLDRWQAKYKSVQRQSKQTTAGDKESVRGREKIYVAVENWARTPEQAQAGCLKVKNLPASFIAQLNCWILHWPVAEPGLNRTGEPKAVRTRSFSKELHTTSINTEAYTQNICSADTERMLRSF